MIIWLILLQGDITVPQPPHAERTVADRHSALADQCHAGQPVRIAVSSCPTRSYTGPAWGCWTGAMRSLST